uniref:Uncharacterized protein n=1 Tax=Caenorhabditis tropicalis TaxID=1561998 RepID=A0A1I7UVE4_9PELO
MDPNQPPPNFHQAQPQQPPPEIAAQQWVPPVAPPIVPMEPVPGPPLQMAHQLGLPANLPFLQPHFALPIPLNHFPPNPVVDVQEILRNMLQYPAQPPNPGVPAPVRPPVRAANRNAPYNQPQRPRRSGEGNDPRIPTIIPQIMEWCFRNVIRTNVFAENVLEERQIVPKFDDWVLRMLDKGRQKEVVDKAKRFLDLTDAEKNHKRRELIGIELGAGPLDYSNFGDAEAKRYRLLLHHLNIKRSEPANVQELSGELNAWLDQKGWQFPMFLENVLQGKNFQLGERPDSNKAKYYKKIQVWSLLSEKTKDEIWKLVQLKIDQENRKMTESLPEPDQNGMSYDEAFERLNAPIVNPRLSDGLRKEMDIWRKDFCAQQIWLSYKDFYGLFLPKEQLNSLKTPENIPINTQIHFQNFLDLQEHEQRQVILLLHKNRNDRPLYPGNPHN